MTELLDLVNVVAGDPDNDKNCLFPHSPQATPPENKWDNNSKKLGDALEDASANGIELYLTHMEETTIATGPSGKKNYTATYNPHHLLPGDASWPKTALKKWIDAAEAGHVQEDIGYDVNCYQNGIDLPSSNVLRGNWTGRDPDFQARYAIAAMKADSKTRQFHDAHKAYNEFAIKVLDKISAKLDALELAGNVGCGDAKCSAEKSSKPYPTPKFVRPRLYLTSERFSAYLWGDRRRWRKPIMTSRFSLMYKKRSLTQEQATEELGTDKFVY